MGFATMAALLCLTLMLTAGPAVARDTHDVCLQGTFIQLLERDGERTDKEWRALFRDLGKLRLRRLIVQWSAYGNIAFYPSRRLDPVASPPLETLLRLADEVGMSVLVGLAHDPDYWAGVGRTDRLRYLEARLHEQLAVARELAPLAARHRSFAGWYITDEIDSLNWHSDSARDALVSYLDRLGEGLQMLAPGREIGISGFASGKTEPEEFERFWNIVLDRVRPIGSLYFQDGIGVGNLDLASLPAYYAAAGRAAHTHGRRFYPIVEVFRQTGGHPVSEGEFRAVPAPAARVAQQVRAAGRYSDGWVAFGIPEYMTPANGAAAGKLYNDYLRLMRVMRADCGPRRAG